MSDKTSIEWTDATWNPIRGCSRISEGCRNCYAERVAARFSGPGQPYEGLATMTPSGPRWTGKIITVDHHLEDPVHWKEPRMIFVNSMADLFHEDLPFSEIRRVCEAAKRAPWHIYQFLTKRGDRMCEFFTKEWDERPPGNWWLGVSVEDPNSAAKRIRALLNTPASVRWISLEPFIDGPIYLDGFDGCDPAIMPLNWVVLGGESGPGARPMHPDWVRSIRDQCQAHSTPFFFKQWGEWKPAERGDHDFLTAGGKFRDETASHQWHNRGDGLWSIRVGKKNAGRLLDGREWNEYPTFVSAAGEQRLMEAYSKCH